MSSTRGPLYDAARLIDSIPRLPLYRKQQWKARLKHRFLKSLAERQRQGRERALQRHPEWYLPVLDVVAQTLVSGPSVHTAEDCVSVILTNYNYGPYLESAIQSVLDQTHRPIEIVAVDDASTDFSCDILRRLLEKAPLPSLRILLKHNVGLPKARNIGIRLARGEYVFILDADDYLASECIALHVQTAKERQADAVYATSQTFGDGRVLKSDAPWSPVRLRNANYIDAMALFRRTTLLEAGLYDTSMNGWEDYELWLRFASQGRRVQHIPKILSYYRWHPESMRSIVDLDTRPIWRYLFRKYPNVFRIPPENQVEEASRRARFE